MGLMCIELELFVLVLVHFTWVPDEEEKNSREFVIRFRDKVLVHTHQHSS